MTKLTDDLRDPDNGYPTIFLRRRAADEIERLEKALRRAETWGVTVESLDDD